VTKWFRLPFLIALSMAPVLAQSAVVAPAVATSAVVTPPHPSWMTDSIVFEFLFRHVMFVESHADQLLAAGTDDSSMRHLFKRLAKLTDQEEALLKSTASDATTGLTTLFATGASVVSGLKAQYPTLASLPASGLQQLQSLDAQKVQIVQSHMATLQAGMPPADYQYLYSFAFGTEGPRIKLGTPGAKPPSGVNPPPALPQPQAAKP
jgi:hypothetical protein